jgi:hypothetical protein
MDHAAAATAIRSRLETAWPGGAYPAVPLRWQNEGPALPAAPYVMIEILGAGEVIAGFGGGPGGNLWRDAGRIEIHVFVARGLGVLPAKQLGEAVCAVYRGQRFGGLQCYAAGEAGEPPSPDGPYYRVDFQAFFRFDRVA